MMATVNLRRPDTEPAQTQRRSGSSIAFIWDILGGVMGAWNLRLLSSDQTPWMGFDYATGRSCGLVIQIGSSDSLSNIGGCFIVS